MSGRSLSERSCSYFARDPRPSAAARRGWSGAIYRIVGSDAVTLSALPTASGNCWEADPIQELDRGKSVRGEVDCPPKSGRAPRQHEKPEEVWKAVPDGGVFILREHRLWTFADLTQ